MAALGPARLGGPPRLGGSSSSRYTLGGSSSSRYTENGPHRPPRQPDGPTMHAPPTRRHSAHTGQRWRRWCIVAAARRSSARRLGGSAVIGGHRLGVSSSRRAVGPTGRRRRGKQGHGSAALTELRRTAHRKKKIIGSGFLEK